MSLMASRHELRRRTPDLERLKELARPARIVPALGAFVAVVPRARVCK
jgi:hypothetical protein